MQCAQLVKDGKAYAVGSQDYDALVVGGERLIQNLTLARKRKTVSGYVEIAPEIIEYKNFYLLIICPIILIFPYILYPIVSTLLFFIFISAEIPVHVLVILVLNAVHLASSLCDNELS